MTDVHTPEQRRRNMAAVRSRKTMPERQIRSGLQAAGLRFRNNYPRLPGHPDIALPRWRTVVLVHGCFWHGHGCHLFRWPKQRADFWKLKIEANCRRDARQRALVLDQGWRIVTVWECALRGRNAPGLEAVVSSIKAFLNTKDPQLVCDAHGCVSTLLQDLP